MIAAFDTHSSVKTLTAAGMPEGQAEAITELFKASRDADLNVLATKADLAQLRADLQQQIAELRADLQQQIAELGADLQQQIAELGDLQIRRSEATCSNRSRHSGATSSGILRKPRPTS